MEIIGGVGIEIVGDYSSLQSDLDAAQSLAASAATKIADALDIATPDTAPVTQALQQISDAATSTGQSMATALDVQVAALDVSPVIDSFTALTDSAKATGDAVKDIFSGGLDTGGIADAIEPIWEDLKKLEDEFVAAGGAVTDFSAPMAEAATAIEGVGASAINGQAALQVIIDQLKDGEIGGKEFISMANALASALEAAGAAAAQTGPEFGSGADGEKLYSDAAQAVIDKQAELDGALATAISALGEIHDAYVDGAVGADALARAESDVESAIKAAGSAASEGAEGERQFSDGAQSIIDAQGRLDAELGAAITVLGEIHDAYAAGTVSAETLARAEDEVQAALSAANPELEKAGKDAEDASGGFEQMANSLLAIGSALAITEGLKEFGEAALQAFGEEQQVTIGLTQMSGSAEQAAKVMGELKEQANQAGISQDALLKTAQKLAAVFGTGDGLTGVLKAAENAAAATGNSINAIASSLERVDVAGAVNAKTLINLGLEWKDLASTMGVSIDEAQAKLKKGGQDAAADVQVLLDTINAKFGEAAAAQGAGLIGMFNTFKNQIDDLMQDIGKALAPAIQGLLSVFTNDILPILQGIIKGFESLPAPIQDFVVAIGILAAAIVPVVAGLAGLGLAIDALGTIGVAAEAGLASVGVSVEAVSVAAAAAAPLVVAFVAAFSVLELSGFIDGLKNLGSAISDTVSQMGPSLWEPIKQSIEGVATAAVDTASALSGWSTLTGIVQNLGQEFPPIKDALDKIAVAAKQAADNFSFWDLVIPGVHQAGVAMNDIAAATNVYNESAKVANALSNDFVTNLTRVFDTMNRIGSSGAGGALQSYDDTVQSILSHQVDLNQKLADTKNALDIITKAYQDGTAVNASGYVPSLKDVAAAQQAVDAASTSLHGKQQTLKDTTVVLQQATKELADNTANAVDPTKNLAAAEEALASNVEKTQQSLLHANANLQTAVDHLNDIKAAAANGAASLADVEKAETAVAKAATALEAAQKAANAALAAMDAGNLKVISGIFDTAAKSAMTASDNLKQFGLGLDAVAAKAPSITPLDQAMIDFGVGVGKAKDAVQNLHTPIDQLVSDMGRLVAAAKDSGDWSAFTKALEEFDKRIQEIAKTDLPEAAKQMEAWIQGMINAGAPTQQVQQQLSLLEPILKNMADEDLPGANTAWQKYLDLLRQVPSAVKDIQQAQTEQLQQDQQILASMQARGDAYGYILTQQQKVLQEEIALAEKTGADANDWVLGLEKVKLAQQDLQLQSHGLADQEVKMINDIISGFDQMGSVMADAIVNGKNLGDALIGQFKKIGQSILTDIINAALIPLKMGLIELIGSLLPGMSGALGAVGGSFGTMNVAAGNAASGLTALATAANTAAASINTSVNGAGADSAGKGGIGGIGSTVGMIAEVASAAAAVASAILLAHISSDTGHIEVNTRSALAEALNFRADAWTQHNQLYERLGEVKNSLDKSVDLLAQLKITTGNGLIPADSAALQAINKILGDNEHFLLVELQAIDASTQYINAGVQTVHNDLYMGFLTMHEDLFLIVGTIQTLTSAILYGSHSSQSYSADSEIMQAADGVESAIQSASAQAHAQLSQIDTSVQADTTSGRRNNQLTLDQQAQKRQEDLAAAQAAAQGASSIANQIVALRDEYNADISLMNNALAQAAAATDESTRAGFFALAAQYQTAAQQVSSQITPLLSATTNATNGVHAAVTTVNTSIINGSTDVSYSATNAGVLVSTAVGQSAVTISNAVINSAGASASLFNTGISSLISIVGAFGKVGGGLPGGQSGLPSGSGLGNTDPNGTASYTIPGVNNPGVVNGQQAGFNPNAPATGGMTQAQWNATGHASTAPDWWLKGTPQPGINQGNLPHFQTGGTVEIGGLAVVDTGELVLPERLAAAVRGGETTIGTQPTANTTGGNVLFTEPNKVDLSSADKGFVDHGPSTDSDAWKGLADSVAAVGKAIADQTAARTAAATAKKPGIEVTTVGSLPGVEVTKVADPAAAAIGSAMNKTPVQDPGGNPVKIVGITAQAAAFFGQGSGTPSVEVTNVPGAAASPASAQPWSGQTPSATWDAAKGAYISTGWREGMGNGFSGYDPYNTPGARSTPSPTPAAGPANKTPLVDPTFAQPSGPMNKTPVQDIPSFDVGGFVNRDMLAMIHAGEFIIPNGKVSLPPEVMARIQMPNIPGAPNVPNVPFSTGSNGGTGDSFTFIIQGITDPDVLMREISNRVKTRTGRTARFSN